ncbi:MepB family protein [Reichenbachiella versicolor]|uniref:MepB family protein n=1 Tax=Reichenbachiella versicolor TaxID=1821036 RepID=UPI000D6E967A|nr:MepB family protein [Reichenbachiella versicolor]
MNQSLELVSREVYSKLGLPVSNYQKESESQDYQACRFQLNGRNVICRDAKITPKKVGQFVTFWKREQDGPIEPFQDSDPFDYFIVNVSQGNEYGQFVFPKSTLVNKGLISTMIKEGKRGFRVYPSWDETQSKQAQRTQQWQLNYFYKIGQNTDFDAVSKLYSR